jgi:Glycine zipper
LAGFSLAPGLFPLENKRQRFGRTGFDAAPNEGTARGRTSMKRILGAGILLALAAAMPAQQAAAQDPIGGAIVGGALGGIIGGAIGHGRGAVAGAVIGATTGAVIAAEAQRRNGGYYWWRGGCYYRYPNGSWLGVAPGYCSY